MSPLQAWDAAVAVRGCPVTPWQGYAWRGHRRRFGGLDWQGSLLASGRYHRAPDRFPPELTWPALYLGLSYGVCLGEVLRHMSRALFAQVNDYRFSKILVDLGSVIDCRDLAAIRLPPETLFQDLDFSVGQKLALAARSRSCEAMLVPSATGFPDANLIVFPDLLAPSSSMSVVDTVDPRLYVDRPGS